MSLHTTRSLLAAVAGLIAANPALAGRVVAVDDDPLGLRDKPRRRLDPEPLYREPIRGARLSLSEARAAYATPPADQARADAAAAKRARRQARNLRAAGVKP